MKPIRCLAFVAALAALAADPSPEPEPPSPGKADVRGVVKAFNTSKAGIKGGLAAMLRVEGKKEADTRYESAFVRVDDSAKVFAWKGGKKAEAKLGDILPGSRVQVTFTGAVKDAKPHVYGRAEEVLILEAPKK